MKRRCSKVRANVVVARREGARGARLLRRGADSAYEGMDIYVASLDPKTPAQRQFAANAAGHASAHGTDPLSHLDAIGEPVSWPLVVIVVSWAMILFSGFGVLSRINATTSPRSPLALSPSEALVPHPRTEPAFHRHISCAAGHDRPDAGFARVAPETFRARSARCRPARWPGARGPLARRSLPMRKRLRPRSTRRASSAMREQDNALRACVARARLNAS